MPANKFTFTTTLERNEQDVEITVRFSVENYADACGIPPEFRSRFAGRYDVEILEVIDAEGRDVETTGEESDALIEQAFDQLCYR